jgi:hypothetical protein
MIGRVFTAFFLVGGSMEAAVIRGRVVDSAGRPVASAEIRVWRKTRAIPIGQNEPVKLDKPLRTDGAGQFVTPDTGDPGQAVRVVVLAEGMLAGRSGWLDAGNAMTEVPDLALRRLRAVEGRVADRHERGIEGATVFHAGEAHKRVETKTDAEGRFRLEGVPEGLVAIFGQAPGYRFTGNLVDAEDAALLFTKEGEEPAALAGGAPRMPEAERLALGQRLLEPYLKAVVERSSDRDKYWAILSLGYLEPVEAIERLPQCTFADKTWRDMARGGVISNWIEGKPAEGWDEIRGLIEGSEDEMWVGSSYLGGAEAMSPDDRQARLDWINQGVLHARQCDAPSMRTLLLARAASLLETLGEGAPAEKLASEARGVAPRSPGQDQFALYAFSNLATALALADLPAALECLDRIDNDTFHARASAQVALRLAASQPLEAEKVWRKAVRQKKPQGALLYWRDNESPLLCFRLARADRACAERVAADIQDPVWRVRARGAIAWALVESDLPAARDFLRRAIDDDGFSKGNVADSGLGRDMAAAVMAWLLPVAERVDPTAMGEIFWRAIALRVPTPVTDQLEDEVEIGHARLAQMLARYDSSVARRLLAPVAAHINQWTGPAEEYRQKAMHVIGAAAVVDPLWAADLLEAMPDPPDLAFRRPKNESRNMLVRVLGMNDAALWKHAGYWQPE